MVKVDKIATELLKNLVEIVEKIDQSALSSTLATYFDMNHVQDPKQGA